MTAPDDRSEAAAMTLADRVVAMDALLDRAEAGAAATERARCQAARSLAQFADQHADHLRGGAPGTEADVLSWIHWMLHDRGLATSTVRQRVMMARTADLSAAGLPPQLAARLRSPRVTHALRRLCAEPAPRAVQSVCRDDMDRFLAWCRVDGSYHASQAAALAAVSWGAWLRVSETAGLLRRDIDLDAPAVRLAHQKTRREPEWIDVEPAMLEALRFWLHRCRPAPEQSAWRAAGGRAPHPATVRRILQRHWLAAGLGRLQPHGLRRGAARDALVRGTPWGEIMVRGRWASPRVARLYVLG